jgi:hypothetical protein
MEEDWSKLAANILKSELKRKGLSYDQLHKKLFDLGVTETPNSIKIKIGRGTFQFAFFLQCAAAIGLNNLRLDDLIDKYKE